MQRDTMIVLGHADRVSNGEAIDVCNMRRRGSVTAEGKTDESINESTL